MRNTGLIFTKHVIAMMLVTLWGVAQAAGNSISVSVFYGQKYLTESDWDPIESQKEFGLGMTLQAPDLPVVLVGNLLRSSDSATDSTSFNSPIKFSGKTIELSVGARKNLTEGPTKVFGEGGLLYISATRKVTNLVTEVSEPDSASAFGFWLGGGLDVMLSPVISVGGLIRMSSTYAGSDSLGGTHFGLYAAYHLQP